MNKTTFEELCLTVSGMRKDAKEYIREGDREVRLGNVKCLLNHAVRDIDAETEVRYEIDDAKWTVKEVMYYYGEWIGSTRNAIAIMESVKNRWHSRRFYTIAFSHRLNFVRQVLMYELGSEFIPFIPNYRRLK